MLKRILAGITALLLIGLYIVTLILAVMQNELTNKFLMASIAATFFVPITLFSYQFIYNKIKKDSQERDVK